MRLLPRRLLGAALLMMATAAGAAPALPPPPTAPTDISGVWFGTAYLDSANFYFRPVEGGDPPYTPAGKALYDFRKAREEGGDPVRDPASECMPHGTPHVISTPTPFQVIQTPGQVTFVHEASRNIRLVYLDEPQPAEVDPTFLGHSVGRWEGDILVVDTIGLRSEPWLDFGGTPGSDQMHIVERWRKIDNNNRLEVLVTITDPVNYTRSWTARREFFWSPEERIIEYVCEEFDRVEPGAKRSDYTGPPR